MLRLLVALNLVVAVATAAVLAWHIARDDTDHERARLTARLDALAPHVDTTVEDQSLYNNAVLALCILARQAADDVAAELGGRRDTYHADDQGEQLVVTLSAPCTGIGD
jgi:hypothetical protein